MSPEDFYILKWLMGIVSAVFCTVLMGSVKLIYGVLMGTKKEITTLGEKVGGIAEKFEGFHGSVSTELGFIRREVSSHTRQIVEIRKIL